MPSPSTMAWHYAKTLLELSQWKMNTPMHSHALTTYGWIITTIIANSTMTSMMTYLRNLCCYNHTYMIHVCQCIYHCDDKQVQSYSLTMNTRLCWFHNIHPSNLHSNKTNNLCQLTRIRQPRLYWGLSLLSWHKDVSRDFLSAAFIIMPKNSTIRWIPLLTDKVCQHQNNLCIISCDLLVLAQANVFRIG